MTAVNWKGHDLVAADSEMSLEMQHLDLNTAGPSVGLLAHGGNEANITAHDQQDEGDEDEDAHASPQLPVNTDEINIDGVMM